MKCKMNSIPVDKRLLLTQVSQQVKHPNPVQALLSALADYMFETEINVEHWRDHYGSCDMQKCIKMYQAIG